MGTPLSKVSGSPGPWEPPGPNPCEMERAQQLRADRLVAKWERDVEAIAEVFHCGWDLDALTAAGLMTALQVGEANVSDTLAAMIGHRMVHEVRMALEFKAWEASK